MRIEAVDDALFVNKNVLVDQSAQYSGIQAGGFEQGAAFHILKRLIGLQPAAHVKVGEKHFLLFGRPFHGIEQRMHAGLVASFQSE